MIKYFLITFLIVCFDQASKTYIKLFFTYHQPTSILGSFLNFTYLENPGIVFGLEVNLIFYYIVTFLSMCIICYILFLIIKLYNAKKDNSLVLIAFSLILGGAIGNIIDRLFVIFNLFDYSGVIDFIDIGIGNYRFYIFNIADMSVTIGILLFIYYNYIQNNDINNYAKKI